MLELTTPWVATFQVGWAEQQRLSNNEKKRYWEQKGDEEARRRGVQQQLNDSKKYDSITGKHMLVRMLTSHHTTRLALRSPSVERAASATVLES
jgi:hypothetical protein